MKNNIIRWFVVVFLLLVNTNVFGYSEAPVDITEMDVYELQEAVDKGYLTYELITRLYLDRIEAYDKDHKAIISINKNAIDEAKEKDREYREKGRVSILFGLPVVVKDNIDVLDMPTTGGAKILDDSYPYEDATVIKNIKDKGVIVLAKTNMSEFAFYASSSISSYGITRNAYNTNYSPYGSSGGSAVAVALQYAPFGIGTDTNTSLRAPASANNVVGFRPTLKLLSNEGILPYDVTRDTPGPITKNVVENALLLEAMAGKDEGTYVKDLEKSTLNGMKIGVVDQFLYGDSKVGTYGTGSTYAKLKTEIDRKLKVLENNGVEIIHIDDFYASKWYSVDADTVAGWTMCYGFNEYIKGTNSKIRSFSQLNSAGGHITPLGGYVSDCRRNIESINNLDSRKIEYKDHVENVFKERDLDVLVYPTTKNELSKVGGTGNFETSAFAIAPSLGLPAVSIPLGLIDELPYGLDVVSLKNNEKKIYEFIYGFEKLTNAYVLPDIAKSLYTVSEEVKDLMNLYEKNKDKKLVYIFETQRVKAYFKYYNEVLDFFTNYNDYEDKAEIARTLYANYSNSIDELKNHEVELFVSIGVFIVVIVLIYALLKVSVKRYMKKKKLRLRKKSKRRAKRKTKK